MQERETALPLVDWKAAYFQLAVKVARAQQLAACDHNTHALQLLKECDDLVRRHQEQVDLSFLAEPAAARVLETALD